MLVGINHATWTGDMYDILKKLPMGDGQAVLSKRLK